MGFGIKGNHRRGIRHSRRIGRECDEPVIEVILKMQPAASYVILTMWLDAKIHSFNKNKKMKHVIAYFRYGQAKRSVFALCLACMGLGMQAQSGSNMQDYSLNHNPDDYQIATPNAATFNRYVNNPVDLYSGSAKLDIPIYTLTDGAIQIPIRLHYATTGIKVSEEASWVGLGWNLAVGGYITRRVVGQVDSYSTEPYYNQVINAYDPNKNRVIIDYAYGGWSTQMREAMDWYLTEPSRRKDYREGKYNPDVFSYSCPDGSGQFVIDGRDNNVYLLDRTEDVKVEKIITAFGSTGQLANGSGGRLTGFKLTFPNGTVHQFELKSMMTTATPVYLGVQAEIYALTRTTYPNGQQVNYIYTTASNLEFHYGESVKSMIPSSGVGLEGYGNSENGTVEHSYGSRSLMDLSGSEVILSKIETDNYQVIFTTSSREDLPNVKKLDRIQVKALATGTTCYDQRFAYSYFTSASTGEYWSRYFSNFSAYRQTNHLLKRLKLDAVYNMNGTTEGERYQFYYNSKALPRKDSYAMDYWGYYNGQTSNASLIPDLYYLMWNHYDEYLKIKNLPSEIGTNLPKAMRAYDFESCKACILTGVQYPTGGYSEIVYEPHRFTGDYIPTLAQCSQKPEGVFETTIYDNNSFFAPGDTYPGLPKNYQYNFSTSKHVRVLVSVSRGQNSWKDVADHRAYLYYIENGGGKRVDFSIKEECEDRYQKEEVSHTASPTTIMSKEYIVTVKTGTGMFVVDYPDALGDQTTGNGKNGRIEMFIEFEQEEDAPSVQTESEGAGVRIKEINFYDSPSKQKLLQKTSYEYAGGLLLTPLQFINYYPETYDKLGVHSGETSEGTAIISMMARRSDKLEISGSNLFSSPYQVFPNVGYASVKEIAQGNGQSGYTFHTFHNEAAKTREHSVPIYNPLNGKPTERQYYNASGKLLRKESFTYDAPVYRYYYGMNFYDRMNLFPEIYDPAGSHCMTMNDNIDETIYYQYGFYSSMEFSQDKFEGTYLGGGSRLAMVVHPLNFHNVLLTSKSVWEDGVERKETYTYNPTTLQLKEKQLDLAPNGTLRIAYTYPNDCPWGVYQSMTQKHCIAPVVETKKINNGTLVESVLTEYKKQTETLFVPSAQYRSNLTSGISSTTSTFSSSGRNTTVYPKAYTVYNVYDSYGHALNLTQGGIEKTYLWGYRGQYPVAEIGNATYASVKSALGSLTPENLSKASAPDMTVLRALPGKLPGANVHLYEYKAGAGVSAETVPNGEKTTYEYDALNRLKTEKDHSGKTVQAYEYHYK